MGIDADFRFHVPVDANFPDNVVLQRDEGEFRTYTHPGILSETEKELKAVTAEVTALRKIIDYAKSVTEDQIVANEIRKRMDALVSGKQETKL